MVRLSHDMSHSPQSPASAPLETHHIKISSLLNDNMQSSSHRKIAMPPSGLPTPDSTPLQEFIQESSGLSFQESPSSQHIDPAVLPSEESRDERREVSLFPDDGMVNSQRSLSWKETSNGPVGLRSLSTASLDKSPSALRRSLHVRRASSQSHSSDFADGFEEIVPAEVWFKLHSIDTAGEERPNTITFQSKLWTAASLAPRQYADRSSQNAYKFTFASGNAPGLNWLATVCDQQAVPEPRSLKPRARASSKSELARRASKMESRQLSHRRPSIKKRTNADGGEPEAKRMRAAAVHKEKPNSYHEVPDYSPALSTFNSGNVKALVPKGGRIDLSNDPHTDLIGSELNQQEKNFAEVNQLDINKYLINKRKIFQGRIQVHLQGKKSFTKTHAQQAAIIDVNKASRMWEFFDQAGWLDMKHFKKHIPTELENMLAKNMTISKEYLA